MGWLYFFALPVNSEIWSSVRVRTVAGRSRAVCRYHTAQSRQNAKLFLQSSEFGLPNPSPAGKCAPPPLVPWGGAHSLGREGLGESQFRRGTYTVVLCIYCICTLCHTGRIYSHDRNSAWGMGSSILLVVVLCYVCVQSFGQLRGWLCPEDDSLNIGEKVAEKSPVWKASFSPMFLNNGWKSTFSALRSYAKSESKIIKLIAKL